MRRELSGIRVCIDDQPVTSATLLQYAGAHQLTLTTTLPDHGHELTSAYLGHPLAETVVTRLFLAPGPEPVTEVERHPPGVLPVREQRALCLYDHCNALRQRLVDATGAHVTIDTGERAPQVVALA